MLRGRIGFFVATLTGLADDEAGAWTARLATQLKLVD